MENIFRAAKKAGFYVDVQNRQIVLVAEAIRGRTPNIWQLLSDRVEPISLDEALSLVETKAILRNSAFDGIGPYAGRLEGYVFVSGVDYAYSPQKVDMDLLWKLGLVKDHANWEIETVSPAFRLRKEFKGTEKGYSSLFWSNFQTVPTEPLVRQETTEEKAFLSSWTFMVTRTKKVVFLQNGETAIVLKAKEQKVEVLSEYPYLNASSPEERPLHEEMAQIRANLTRFHSAHKMSSEEFRALYQELRKMFPRRVALRKAKAMRQQQDESWLPYQTHQSPAKAEAAIQELQSQLEAVKSRNYQEWRDSLKPILEELRLRNVDLTTVGM